VRKGDAITVGPMRTHLQEGSRLRSQHHTNWRLKGLARNPHHSPPEFYYSFPMCISEADVAQVRSLIYGLLKEIEAIVKPSKPEKLVCLNIDWFDF
jgi:hypothetical protein